MRNFLAKHGTAIGAIVMGLLLVFYMAIAAWQGILMIISGRPVAIVMGIALLVFPLVGAWALLAEFQFGKRASTLAAELNDAEVAQLNSIANPETGRADRRAATALIEDARKACVAKPDSWRLRMVYSLTLGAAGKRSMARAAAREAIKLSRSGPIVASNGNIQEASKREN